MDLSSDRELLDAFRKGERDALQQVYRAHVAKVQQVITYGCNTGSGRVPGVGRERCEDLVQEVFVKAFAERARQAYDGLRPYEPYLLQIARNLLVDRARRSGRELLATDDAEQEPLSPLETSLERQMHFGRLREATVAFLASLSDEEQRFVELRFVQELSQYEVSSAMGLTRRRVRTLEKRAQEGLAAYLEQQGLRLRSLLELMLSCLGLGSRPA